MNCNDSAVKVRDFMDFRIFVNSIELENILSLIRKWQLATLWIRLQNMTATSMNWGMGLIGSIRECSSCSRLEGLPKIFSFERIHATKSREVRSAEFLTDSILKDGNSSLNCQRQQKESLLHIVFVDARRGSIPHENDLCVAGFKNCTIPKKELAGWTLQCSIDRPVESLLRVAMYCKLNQRRQSTPAILNYP